MEFVPQRPRLSPGNNDTDDNNNKDDKDDNDDKDNPNNSSCPSPVSTPEACGIARPQPSPFARELLTSILKRFAWEDATAHVALYPWEAALERDPSPLALACRHGAPLECVLAILQAAPYKLRHMMDAWGTPIHEAIMNEQVGPAAIAALLAADEALDETTRTSTGVSGVAAQAEGPGLAVPVVSNNPRKRTLEQQQQTTRATLQQDVDGNTPLHLFIRRCRDQIPQDPSELMQILEMLVRSCPQAVVIPDRGQWGEPPIVHAIKASGYAYRTDDFVARCERLVFDVVTCMLRHCPEAASRTFTGYSGSYTALHSAAFHGNATRTIDLLLRTESRQRPRREGESQAALLANTQGELPLHFCTMRGDSPRTVVRVAQAARAAIGRRDTSGLTPFHWLWIRFVGNWTGRDEALNVVPMRLALSPVPDTLADAAKYAVFSSLERGHVDHDLPLIRRMDPPVDYLRMRHIPEEGLGAQDSLQLATQCAGVLERVREAYVDISGDNGVIEDRLWNGQEVLCSLFWTKVVSLLAAIRPALPNGPQGPAVLVHTAFAAPSCPPPIVAMAASLYPEEMNQPDKHGRLPLHYAARRPWHMGDFPREPANSRGPANATAPLLVDLFAEQPANEGPATLLVGESLRTLRLAVERSEATSFGARDVGGRLPLHHVIDTMLQACERSIHWVHLGAEMLQLVDDMVQVHPDVLTQADGHTGFCPFLQATAQAADSESTELFSISLCFRLLRESPTALPMLR